MVARGRYRTPFQAAGECSRSFPERDVTGAMAERRLRRRLFSESTIHSKQRTRHAAPRITPNDGSRANGFVQVVGPAVATGARKPDDGSRAKMVLSREEEPFRIAPR